MYDDDGNKIEVEYNIGWTILSLVLVILFSMLGFYISSHDKVFMKTKKEIVEMFVEDAQRLSMKKIQHMDWYQILSICGLRSLEYLLLGGFCTGSGVVVMHYVGMAAMTFRGHIVWRSGVIAASVCIAFVAATAAFWIQFRLLSIYSNKENLRVASALIMAIAVCGMHYCGMSAADFHLDKDAPFTHVGAMSPVTAYEIGIISAGLITFLSGMVALSDLRYSVLKLSYELLRADELIMSLPMAANSSSERSVHRYIVRRKLSNFNLGVLNDTYDVEMADPDDNASSQSHMSEDANSVHSSSVHHLAETHTSPRSRKPSASSSSAHHYTPHHHYHHHHANGSSGSSMSLGSGGHNNKRVHPGGGGGGEGVVGESNGSGFTGTSTETDNHHEAHDNAEEEEQRAALKEQMYINCNSTDGHQDEVLESKITTTTEGALSHTNSTLESPVPLAFPRSLPPLEV